MQDQKLAQNQNLIKLLMTRKEVLIISSVGGHLLNILKIKESFLNKDYLFVVNDRTDLDAIMIEKTIRITHAERNLLQFINLIESIYILIKYRPKIILSAGAAPAVLFSYIGKYLFGSKIIFIESISRVKTPSLSGKMIYPIADRFYVQWDSLKEYFPNAIFTGSILWLKFL